MMSRNSCSKGLVRDCMKRNLWAIVLSTVGFFMAQLLPVIMTAQHSLSAHKQDLANLSAADAAASWQGYVESVGEMLGGQNVFVKLAVIILAVTCGVSMFAYLHNRRKVDFYHSLPISRSRLFAVDYATGALCALVPYLVLHALSIVSACAMGFGEVVNASLIGVIASNVIFFFLLYAMAAVTTIFCGNTVITLLLGLWVYFGPVLVKVLWNGLLEIFFTTYYSGESPVNWVVGNKLCPMVHYFGVNGTHYMTSGFSVYAYTGVPYGDMIPSAVGTLVSYAVAAVVITALALFLFRIRKSERAGTALAFKPAKLPVKVIISAVMGVALAELFYLIVDSSKLWFWVGLVLGTVIFHCVVEIIYAFDFRAIFRKPIHLAVILAVLVGGMLTMQADVIGYDKWLPDEGSIEAVSVDYNMGYESSRFLSDPENIAAVRQLAAIGVEHKDDPDDSNGYLVTAFRMENGKIKTRGYSLPHSEEVSQLENQVYQSVEYKKVSWTLFNLGEVQEGCHRTLAFYTNGGGNDCAGTLANEQQVNEIIETLQSEALSHTADAMPVLHVEFAQEGSKAAMNEDYRYGEGGACVTEKDVKTLALIKQYAGVEPKPLSSENVQSAMLSIYLPEKDCWQSVDVTDKADIDALLKNAVNIDAMSLYGSNMTAYGVASDWNTADIYVNYKNDANGEVWTASVGYLRSQYPTAIIEKYRAQAEKDAKNGVVSAQDGDVAYTTEVAVG